MPSLKLKEATSKLKEATPRPEEVTSRLNFVMINDHQAGRHQQYIMKMLLEIKFYALKAFNSLRIGPSSSSSFSSTT